ncbi:MAG TPA: peptide ABC transporter substrate-binding protein [Candidatus Paceibacterota bacterium]|nr:peptide ABC transporter substrate-binding protein [Candidatus Paceibacterota bacterium]
MESTDPSSPDGEQYYDLASIPQHVRSITQRVLHMRSVPGIAQLERAAARFSPAERLLLAFLTVLLAAGAIGMLAGVAAPAMSEQPAPGGTLTEGIVGTPRFINPLLASSDADRDLTALVYSGLMRAMPDGSYVPDLASGYTVSDDGKTYTFTIRPDAVFQDGTPVTAEDVVFTISEAQDPDIKSPERANWDGVTVTALDEHTVQFTLPAAYAPFLENTTIGILPKHLWGDVTADEFAFNQLNTKPVGSGPYAVSRIRTDQSGTPTEYVLTAFDSFALGAPYIRALDLKFYASEDAQISAYQAGSVDAVAGITATKVPVLQAPADDILTATLPRDFAVFLNQNQQPIFLDGKVREALSVALDKQSVIATALAGYGVPLDGPIPPGVMQDGYADVATSSPAAMGSATSTAATSSPALSAGVLAAREILEKDGWTLTASTSVYAKKGQPLAFSISTADTPELVATANAVAAAWKAMGADVTVKVFSAGSINVNVIRSRNYDALLFGEVVGRSLDLFAFWDSAQRNDPGLNLALYTNSKADTLLSEARGQTDRALREADYEQFAGLVKEDHPAVFLYAPDFIYVIPQDLKGVQLGALTSAADRFDTVYRWYIESKSVWDIFSS